MTIQESSAELRRRSIERKARDLQLRLWDERHTLWANNVPSSPLAVLEPGVALNALGYHVKTVAPEQCWEAGIRVEVAGTIDPKSRVVTISSTLSENARRFTTAHELAHAILHPRDGTLHKDRAIAGPTYRRERREREADYFASCFLMPEKQVRRVFEQNFLVETFALTDDTSFALCTASYERVSRRLRTPRDIARALATTLSYGGREIPSLSSTFTVSADAMAIRLNELDLIVA